MSEPSEFQNLAGDVQVLKVQIQSIANSVEALVSRQSSFERAVSDGKQFKWPVVISSVGAVAIIIAGLVQLIDLKTQNAELHNMVRITNLLAPISARADSSETDRSKINNSLSTLAERQSEMRTLLATVGQQIVELETQTRATAQISNLQVSYEHAIKSILWQEMKGYPLPSDLYFPDVTLPKPGALK